MRRAAGAPRAGRVGRRHSRERHPAGPPTRRRRRDSIRAPGR